ncbi:hypothetical protein [Roseicella aquatilis]|uniref:hypothetical protein n=1 Tax=Roseicella aquatilis TaxID=2527868 RepID=UPI001404569F|nr:hypothetical protein [Roseicella aquatilis]
MGGKVPQDRQHQGLEVWNGHGFHLVSQRRKSTSGKLTRIGWAPFDSKEIGPGGADVKLKLEGLVSPARVSAAPPAESAKAAT